MPAVDAALHGPLRKAVRRRGRAPPGADPCEEPGVSRVSLREAVRAPAAPGVIDPRHGSGTYVPRLRPPRA